MEESGVQHSDQAVIVALGSNLGGAYASPAEAVEAAIGRLGEVGLTVVRRSRLWRSSAWPDPSDPDYVNAVLVVEGGLPPGAVLAALHAVEAEFGRSRTIANAPRELDLDLIAYARMVVDEDGMTIPHPRAAERLFVMGPLAEIAPDWVHPVLGRTARQLAEAASVGRDARPL